jgi:rhamnosyltransferase
MSESEQPFSSGTAFWCKTDALAPLLFYPWRYEDFAEEPLPVDGTISHGIEHILPYVAQSQGYLSGTVATAEYQSLYVANFQYMLGSIIREKLLPQGIIQFSSLPLPASLKKFIKSYEKVYIYGAGMQGNNCLISVGTEKIAGFIVSDGRCSFTEKSGKKIYELSEIAPAVDTGIIVAMNGMDGEQVKKTLVERGYNNYIDFLG